MPSIEKVRDFSATPSSGLVLAQCSLRLAAATARQSCRACRQQGQDEFRVRLDIHISRQAREPKGQVQTTLRRAIVWSRSIWTRLPIRLPSPSTVSRNPPRSTVVFAPIST